MGEKWEPGPALLKAERERAEREKAEAIKEAIRMLKANGYRVCKQRAAPDLLKALKQIVIDYQDVPDATDANGQAVFDDARAAIAKAEVASATSKAHVR